MSKSFLLYEAVYAGAIIAVFWAFGGAPTLTGRWWLQVGAVALFSAVCSERGRYMARRRLSRAIGGRP